MKSTAHAATREGGHQGRERMTFMTRATRVAAVGLIAAGSWLGIADTARAQGTVRLAIDSELNTLDPAKMRIGVEYNYANMVFSGLTQFDREGN